MSHPETYYDAKAVLLATARSASVYLPGRATDEILAALGWPAPAPARDLNGRIVKVYSSDLRLVLPNGFHEALGRRFNSKYVGYIVGTSKQDVGDRTSSRHYTKSQRAMGITQVDPTDLMYPLAVAAPADHAVIVIENGVDNEPIVFPLADLTVRATK